MAAIQYVSKDTFDTAMIFIKDNVGKIEKAVEDIQKCNLEQARNNADLAQMIKPLLNDYKDRIESAKRSGEIRQSRRWDVKLLMFGGSMGVGFAAVTSIILYLLKVPT